MAQTEFLNITVDPIQLREVETYLRNVKNGAPKVMADAINRTLDQLKTFVSTQMGKKAGIPKPYRDRRIDVIKTAPAQLSGTLRIEYEKRLSLGDFDPKNTRSGVSVKMAPRGRKFIPGAFVVDLPKRDNGDGRVTYQQVFKKKLGWEHREPQQGKRRGRRRKGLSGLPVISLKGVSPWGVFVKGGLQEPTIAKANELLAKNIENRLDRLLFTRTGVGLATIRAGGEE